jgi:Trk-type K+ transport system membrane component
MEDKVYVLVLNSIRPDKKIEILRKIREYTQLDVQPAKNIVDTPKSCVISSLEVPYERLLTIKKDLELCGANVEIREKNDQDQILTNIIQKQEIEKTDSKKAFLFNVLSYAIFIIILFAIFWLLTKGE